MKGLMLKSALVAVLLAVLILLLVFHALPPKHSSGYFVKLAPARCPLEDETNADRFIILRVTNGSVPYINYEPAQWDTLESRLSEIYSARMYRTLYVAAEDGVSFQRVADAIDIVESTRSNAPPQHGNDHQNLDITVRLITPAALNAPCPQPLVIRRSGDTLR